MFELLTTLTALVLVIGVIWAYRRSADVFHPMMFLGPLFIVGAALEPWLVRKELPRFFPVVEDVNVASVLFLLCVTSLVLGASHYEIWRVSRSAYIRGRTLSERENTLLRRAAAALAVCGLATYVYGLANVGGFQAAFSQAKGGGNSEYGYINEAMNLSLVAAAMVGVSRYRRGWTRGTLTLWLIGLLPNLLQGSFGGRRGPLFLALSAGMLSWFIVRRRAPRFWAVLSSLAAVVLAVVFIGSQRQFLYLGSGEGVRWEEFTGDLTASDVDQGNNFIYGAGFVLATRHAGEYTWGRELAVNLLVRPVPRQVWPTKYEDVGATWITAEHPGLGHLTYSDWLAAVGWIPLQGSSAISISDAFGELSWGAVFVFYLIGRGFAALNWRRRTCGGVWELLYLEALILSIYLATQSLSAFYHRYLILAVPTVIAWRLFVERRPIPVQRRSSRRTSALQPAARQPSVSGRL